jgi:hypothetical protein
MRGTLASRPGMPNHLDQHSASILCRSDLAEEVDASPLTPSSVFNLSEKPTRSTEVIVASVASIPACDFASKIIAST